MQSIPHSPADRPLQGIGAQTLRLLLAPTRSGGMGSRYHLRHLWMPVAAFVGLSIVLMGLHGDQWLADRIYAMEGHAWTLQAGYITRDLVHDTGRQVSKIAWGAVVLTYLASLFVQPMTPWRRPLLYLLVSVLLATALVALMKHWTHMDCPWDLARYGGGRAYYGLFTARPRNLHASGCFPAGHAGAGYAWVSLYFFFRAMRPRWRWWGLGLALSVGLVFGIAQQLRGAHFLSHDVWALMICWLTALALSRWMLRRGPRAALVKRVPMVEAFS